MTMTKAAINGIPLIDDSIQKSGDWAGGSSKGEFLVIAEGFSNSDCLM